MIASFAWRDWEKIARIGNVAGKKDRPNLASIYLDATDGGRVAAVATDSFKLAVVTVDYEAEEESPVLLSARQVKTATTALRQLARTQVGKGWQNWDETSRVSITPSIPGYLVMFSVEDRLIGSLTVDDVDGRFPAYRALLRKPGDELAPSTLARKTREEVLDYVNLRYGKAWSEDSKKKDLLAYDAIKREEPVARSIGLNPDYLQQLMRTTTTTYPNPLRIEMFGVDRPIFLSNPSDKDWQGIQMPVRS